MITKLLAAATIIAAAAVPLHNERDKVDNDLLQQFAISDWENVGTSVEEVCSGDYSVGGYSCVTNDLANIGFSVQTIPIIYDSSRIVTMSDDAINKEVFIYVYRTDKLKEYSKVSLSLDPTSFDTMRTKNEPVAAFTNFDITPVSISSDGLFVKYRIDGVSDKVDFTLTEREYVVREIIDWEHRSEESAILPSGMIYGVRTTEDKNLEVVQTALNLFTAKQLVVDTYFPIANVSHNYVKQQNTLLFSLYKSGELFISTLRAIEVQCSSYQFYGRTNLHDGLNGSRGDHFVKQAYKYNWKSGAEGMNEADFHILNEKKNDTLIIEPETHEISYKPTMWHWWNTKKYTWNTLGKCDDLAQSNGGYVDDSIAKDYTYYAVLRESGMYLGHHSSDVFTIENQTEEMTEEGNYKNIPSYFYDVSLARFWYEEGTKVKQGIVISTFNDDFGAVELVNAKSQSMPGWLKTIIIVGCIILGIIIFSLICNVLGILQPIIVLFGKGIKGFFLLISWPVRFIVRKVKGD